MKYLKLDCTLRDGGYYTSWEFEDEVVENYLSGIESTEIDMIEVGYISPKLDSGYFGEYFYLGTNRLKWIKQRTSKKIGVMIDFKNYNPVLFQEFLDSEEIRQIDFLRIAVSPYSILELIKYENIISKINIPVYLNFMYLSKWLEIKEFIPNLKKLDQSLFEGIYLVDSYGSCSPLELNKLFRVTRENWQKKIGFHGHNNLELALANTITAIELNIDLVDSTITGMGRGAGNLKTELLLCYENENNLKERFIETVNLFEKMQKKYEWGTNLAYIYAGKTSFPQGKIMESLTLGNLSYGDLFNQIKPPKNKPKSYNEFKARESNVLIVGGGNSSKLSKPFLENLITKENIETIIFASGRWINLFDKIKKEKFVCIIGNEIDRIPKSSRNSLNFIVPNDGLNAYHKEVKEYKEIYSVGKIDKLKIMDLSHTYLLISALLNLKPKKVFSIGYEGYGGKKNQEVILQRNNEELFRFYSEKQNPIVSLTKTNYVFLSNSSIYAYK